MTTYTRKDLDETGNKMLWISWSRILEYHKCPQKSMLHMAGKGSTIKEGRNFVSGTVADRAMRKWLEQDSPHLDGQMEQYVYELWDQYTNNSDEYNVTWKKDDPVADQNKARNLAIEAVNALEPFLRARVLPYNFQPEWRFQVPLQLPWRGGHRTVVLNGGADIIVSNPEDDSWFIYDLKVTRNEKYIEGAILPQLIFYQIAAHMELGAPFDKTSAAFLTPACKTQYHSLNIGSEDRRHLMNRIVRFAEAVWTDEEGALCDDQNMCYFCDVKQHCPRFATVTSTQNGKKTVSLSETAKLRKKAKENEL